MFWGVTAGQANDGMWAKQAVLPRGTLLYRFIDLMDGWVDNAADGAWWFEAKQFETIQGFGRRHGYNLAQCVDMLASIHGEYANVNAIVWAKVHPGPLLVWKGTAKPADAELAELGEDAFGEPLSPESDDAALGNRPLSVTQIFVPGLGAPYRRFGSYMKLLGAARLDMEWPLNAA
jgi:hypothetical protein